MKKHFTHENLERFLKESADDLQMRPSADVWSRIQHRMNRRRRWVFFSSAFFLLTTSLFGYLIIDHSKNAADPFAGVQTLSRKADAKPANTAAEPVATNASLQRTSTARPRSTAAPVNKKAVNPSNSQNRGQLGKPIVPQNDVAPVAEASSPYTPTVVDELQPFSNALPETSTEPQTAKNEILTIESVVNSYSPKRVKRKPEFQLFFTPTVSYRRLTENKSYLRAVPQSMASFNIAALYDVNSMVTHKPDLGLELGFALKVPVTGRIKLRTGMQFNITRYDIKAFTSYRPERATIALNTRSRGVDSVATVSNYRNGSGGRADWLQNFYFQVSAPVGVEVVLSNNKKTQFGVAGSVQPTYVLGDRAYLISSDYKNYSQVPWLIRRWNVNTSLETFVSYSTGKLRWQVGPQVRYQLLSSFVEKYPVKENLFDYGLKIGVSLDKK